MKLRKVKFFIEYEDAIEFRNLMDKEDREPVIIDVLDEEYRVKGYGQRLWGYNVAYNADA